MATTHYGVNASEAVKLWSEKLSREVIKETFIGRFMGRDSNSVIQVYDDFKKSKGDRVRTILRVLMTGPGVQGDSTLEGNEESLTTYTDDLIINQLRQATRSGGEMSEQRVPFSVRSEGEMALREWWADRFDTWFFNQISGNSTQADTRYTGHNTVTAPDSAHRIYANGHTTEASLTATASAIFSTKLIDQVVLKAKTLSPSVRPVKTGHPNARYVMFITPEMHYDLRRSVATANDWGSIQSDALKGGQITKNPIFTGALGLYNGVILHEADRLPIYTSTGGSTYARAVLCGAQAAAMAFGRGASMSRLDWKEKLFDYDNQLGIKAGCIAGLKKNTYNSKDFGTITVTAAHSTDAANAQGRS